MVFAELSDAEVVLELARAMKKWRIDPAGAGLSQKELSLRSGAGLTPLKRFEKTGNITLRNFVALMRALGLLDRLEDLVPSPAAPGPLELLARERKAGYEARRRAPRKRKA
jgi:hypothetical protein